VIDRADLAALPPVEAIDALPVEALPAFVTRLAALTAAAGARLVAEGSTQAAHEPMTLEQVAEHLHVSRKRVLELTREAGGLPRIEVSRKEILVRRSDLTAWLAGDELRRVRKRLGLTQVQLAKELGVHWNSVARWERGEVGISEPVAKLLRILARPRPARR